MKHPALCSAAAAASLFAVSAAHAGPYTQTVESFNPTHFYRLDETGFGTVTDSATPPPALIHGSHEGQFPPGEIGAAGVPLPGFDADNRSLFTNNVGGVVLGEGTDFASDVMSIAVWTNSNTSVTPVGDRLFTNNVVRNLGETADSFQITVPAPGNPWSMAIATGQDISHQVGVPLSAINVMDNQWHHVVVVRNGDDINNLQVIIDGVDYSDVLEPTSANWGTTGTNAHLGVRADGGGSEHNYNGFIDDTALWLGRAITPAEAKIMYDAAFIPEPAALGLLSLGGLLGLRRRR